MKSVQPNCVSIEKLSEKSTAQKFLLAVVQQNYEIIQGFIETEKLHPDTRFENKPTAICYATLIRDICLLKYLVQRGADVTFSDQRGMTPLHYAALGGCAVCVQYLLYSGADVNAYNIDGETPMHLASRKHQSESLRNIFLRHGGHKIYFAPEIRLAS